MGKSEYQRAYRKANAEKIKAYNKAYAQRMRETDPNKMKTYLAEWRAHKKQRELLGQEAINLVTAIHLSKSIDNERLETFIAKIKTPNS
jgi:hypothetical protein